MKRKKRKTKKKETSFFKKLMFSIIILLILFTFILGILIYKKSYYIQDILRLIIGQEKTDLDSLNTIYILLMGVSTDLNTELTDTIILCGYNPKSNYIMLLSIPRDTYIGKDKNNAKSSNKINALYSKNINTTLSAVRNITGIDVNYYAVIKTETLVELVDIIGGVDFDVPIDMTYDDPTQDLHINLQKGFQKLDGNKSEMLLRFRHNNDGSTYPTSYGDNDFGRMRTQREFIKATISQTIKLQNLLKIKPILDLLNTNLDTNIQLDTLLPYLPYGIYIDTNNISMEQLPGNSELCNNIWIYNFDKNKTKSLIDNLTNELEQ